MIGSIDVSAIITAVTALVVAVGAIMTNRQRKTAVAAAELETERNDLWDQLQAALRYIHALGLLLASHGIEVPPKPDALTQSGKRTKELAP